MIVVNVIFNFYFSKLSGWLSNVGLIFVIVIALRHGGFIAGIINLCAAFGLGFILTPGTMFPVLSVQGYQGFALSLALDYIGATFVAIYLSWFMTKKISNLTLRAFSLTIINGLIYFLSTFTTGVLVWGEYVGSGLGVYVYSFVYNFTAALLSTTIALILVWQISKNYRRILMDQEIKNPFFDDLIQKNAKKWTAYTQHRFADLVASGLLSDKQFEKYIIQDAIYLNEYAKCWNKLASLASNTEDKNFALKNAKEIIEEEQKIRQKYNNKQEKNFQTTTETQKYVKYMQKIASKNDYHLLFFCLMGCFIGYAYLGKYIKSKLCDDKYKKFIELYTSPIFYKTCDYLIEKINYLGEIMEVKKQRKVNKVFAKTLVLETHFFDQVT